MKVIVSCSPTVNHALLDQTFYRLLLVRLQVVSEVLFLLHSVLSSPLILSTVFDTVNQQMLFAALADLKIAESALSSYLSDHIV